MKEKDNLQKTEKRKLKRKQPKFRKSNKNSELAKRKESVSDIDKMLQRIKDGDVAVSLANELDKKTTEISKDVEDLIKNLTELTGDDVSIGRDRASAINEVIKPTQKPSLVAQEGIQENKKQIEEGMLNVSKLFNTVRFGEDINLNQENANNDGFTATGYKEIFTNKALERVAEELLDDDVLQKFKSGEIHIHDFNSYAIGTLTCLQIPLDKALALYDIKDIVDASSKAAMIMHVNQTQMHGGQAYPNFDFDLAPYVEMTYLEAYNNYVAIQEKLIKEIYFDSKDDKELALSKVRGVAHNDALMFTKEQTLKAMSNFVFDLNKYNLRGGQTTFGSVNFGLDTSLWGQILSDSLLQAQMNGIDGGKTPNFPILILKVSKDINFEEGTPNYHIYQKSLECLAERLFPNFQFIDSSMNINPHSDDPRKTIATMGCVDGDELIEVKIGANAQPTFMSFAKFYDSSKEDEHTWVENGVSKYKKLNDVYVRDINRDFTKVLGVVKNPDMGNWYRIECSDDSSLLATADHPMVVVSSRGRERKFIEDIKIGDILISVTGETTCVVKKSFFGFLNEPSYDFTTESDTLVISGLCSHNCRTRVFEDVNGENNSVSRGNLSFSTINLPMIAAKSEGDLDEFYKLLNDDLELLARQLYKRMEYQGSFKAKEFPFLYNGLYKGADKLKPDDLLFETLKSGSLSIGFVGLAETLILLTGKHHGEDDNAQKLGLEIIKFMRDFTDKKKDETKLNYSLLATPAEGYAGKSLKAFVAKYGETEKSIPQIGDNTFFTNSFHVPVWYKISHKKKIEIEAPYHALTNAGHISYIEVDGDARKNTDALDAIVREMSAKDMGYGAINLPLDRCDDCGFAGVIEEDNCPVCSSENIKRTRRVTGYLASDMSKWNSAKRDEESKRVKHN